MRFRWRSSREAPKRTLAVGAVAIHEEMRVKGEGVIDAQALHDGERSAIYKAEGLVGKGLRDAPRSF
jgi:hypothetical protein